MYVCGLAAASAAFLRNREEGRTNNILCGAPVHVVLTGSSCTCTNSSEFAQLTSNIGKGRMTQLTAYLFVAIPISLGANTSVDCMKGRYHLVCKLYFGAERSS